MGDIDGSGEVVRWVRAEGVGLGGVAPDGPLGPMEPLRDVVGDAGIVGIGVPTHGAHELSLLAHRIVRFLVERMGFGAVALEEAPTAADRVDAYVATGAGDPREALSGLWPHHRTREVLGLVDWMRERSAQGDGRPLRFVGLDVEPTDRVEGDRIAQAEPALAASAIRFHQESGARVAYWGGFTHTGVGDARTVTVGAGSATHRNAGSHLRDRLGAGYVSLGLTFGCGTVAVGDSAYEIPAAPPVLTESALGDPDEPVLVRLRRPLPEAVRRWAEAPATLRLVGPRFDPARPDEARMSGGSLAAWFDAVAHVGHVGPTHSLD
jgi:erythromycin esterase